MDPILLVIFLLVILWGASLLLLFYVIRGAALDALRTVRREQEAPRR